MADAGIKLFMFDAHSFGRSEPREPGYRSLVLRWEDLVDDIYLFKKVMEFELLEYWHWAHIGVTAEHTHTYSFRAQTTHCRTGDC